MTISSMLSLLRYLKLYHKQNRNALNRQSIFQQQLK